MSETDTSERDEYEAEQVLWDTYRQVRRTKGIDVQKGLAEFAKKLEQKLALPGARQDFIELCDAGCTPEVLAAIIALLRGVPYIERIWASIVGQPGQRHKVARTLENAALALEELFGEVTAAEDQKKLRAALSSLEQVPPSDLASQLRFYIGFLGFAETLASDTEVRSIHELSKYILVSYVNRATGRPHDRNVSGLLGEIEGFADSDEVAHRMWRNRNYSRLHKHFSKLAEFLFAMGVVIARRT